MSELFPSDPSNNKPIPIAVALKTLATEIIPSLKEHGICVVNASYSTEGRDVFDTIEYLDADEQPIDRTDATPSLDQGIDRVLFAFVPEKFDIDPGSHGTLTLDAEDGTVSLSHTRVFQEWTSWTDEWEI